MFQSTRPRGARPFGAQRAVIHEWFQSTRPRGARPGASATVSGAPECFNPRARVGRDDEMTADLARAREVSIHAPAWGATLCNMSRSGNHALFQSTRPRGARPSICCGSRSTTPFQSTRPRGARLFDHSAPHVDRWVSIHAPAWGATVWSMTIFPVVCCFNPRARVGRDQGRVGQRAAARVSIHAPAWGATLRATHAPQGRLVSIHAPAWGATPCPPRYAGATARFNPRARVGRDRRRLQGRRTGRQVSIHAPAWGATRGSCTG